MGFGTLLGGYFLLLNFTYYRFTDVIAALLMLYALYKLSGINQMFKLSAIGSAVFSAFGLAELVLGFLEIFSIIELSPIAISLIAMLRNFAVGLITVLMLIGIRDVAAEVGLPRLQIKANYLSYVTMVVYVGNIFLQTAELSSWIPVTVLVPASIIFIIATMALICVNLSAIFTCYQKICMPSEKKETAYKEKKSRFGFVNRFRAHEEQRQREYAEYKLDKMKKKSEKRKSGGKKK